MKSIIFGLVAVAATWMAARRPVRSRVKLDGNDSLVRRIEAKAREGARRRLNDNL